MQLFIIYNLYDFNVIKKNWSQTHIDNGCLHITHICYLRNNLNIFKYINILLCNILNIFKLTTISIKYSEFKIFYQNSI